MLRERLNVADAMDKRVIHMLADGAGRLRDKQDAPTPPGLRRHESASFLNRRQDQDLAFPHEIGHIIAVSQYVDAGSESIVESFSVYPGMNSPAIRKLPSR